MEKRGTEENRTRLKGNSWELEEDAFEFIEEEEGEEVEED